MVTIYLDVLIVLNIYVNYFLLKATAKLTHTKLQTLRSVISSIVGSLFSFTILVPNLNPILALLIKLAAAIVVVGIAFGIKDRRLFLKLILFFFTINFLFAGTMLTVWLLAKPSFIHVENLFVYVDFSLLTLVISTIIAYFFTTAVRYLLDRKLVFSEKYRVIITANGATVSMLGIADTGNMLTDIFSGKSIIICSKRMLENIPAVVELDVKDIDKFQSYIATHQEKLNGLRLIPFNTINSSGVIPIFKPKDVYIKSETSGAIKAVDVLVGINENQENDAAIFNPSIIL